MILLFVRVTVVSCLFSLPGMAAPKRPLAADTDSSEQSPTQRSRTIDADDSDDCLDLYGDFDAVAPVSGSICVERSAVEEVVWAASSAESAFADEPSYGIVALNADIGAMPAAAAADDYGQDQVDRQDRLEATRGGNVPNDELFSVLPEERLSVVPQGPLAGVGHPLLPLVPDIDERFVPLAAEHNSKILMRHIFIPSDCIIALSSDSQHFKHIDHVNSRMGFTLLMLACGDGNIGLVKLLLRSNADSTLKGPEGGTAFHLAACDRDESFIYTPYEAEGDRLAIAIMAFFLDGNFVSIDILDSNGETPLERVVQWGALARMQFLIARGARIQRRSGASILHLAAGAQEAYCRDDDESFLKIQWIIDQNMATPDSQNLNGYNALHLTLEVGLYRAFRWLWQKYPALRSSQTNQGKTLLHIACEREDAPPDLVLAILQEDCIPINSRNIRGETPLFSVTLGENWAIVPLLLRHGSDGSMRNNQGFRALDSVVCEGLIAGVRALGEHNADLNGRSPEGLTALDYATLFCHWGIFLYLNQKMGEPVRLSLQGCMHFNYLPMFEWLIHRSSALRHLGVVSRARLDRLHKSIVCWLGKWLGACLPGCACRENRGRALQLLFQFLGYPLAMGLANSRLVPLGGDQNDCTQTSVQFAIQHHLPVSVVQLLVRHGGRFGDLSGSFRALIAARSPAEREAFEALIANEAQQASEGSSVSFDSHSLEQLERAHNLQVGRTFSAAGFPQLAIAMILAYISIFDVRWHNMQVSGRFEEPS